MYQDIVNVNKSIFPLSANNTILLIIGGLLVLSVSLIVVIIRRKTKKGWNEMVNNAHK